MFATSPNLTVIDVDSARFRGRLEWFFVGMFFGGSTRALDQPSWDPKSAYTLRGSGALPGFGLPIQPLLVELSGRVKRERRWGGERTCFQICFVLNRHVVLASPCFWKGRTSPTDSTRVSKGWKNPGQTGQEDDDEDDAHIFYSNLNTGKHLFQLNRTHLS